MPTFDEESMVQWQRWQPENLLGDSIVSPLPVLDTPASDEQLKAELTRLQKQAEQQGYSKGHTVGQDAGYKQGYETGMQAGREAGFEQGLTEARANQLVCLKEAETWVSNFRLALDNLESLVPARLVQLALTAVQQLYGNVSVADNSALIRQIRKLMKEDTLLKGNVQLHVHPDTRVEVLDAMGETLSQHGWALHSDPHLVPGGCRLTSSDAEYDASLETRWQSICQLAREELSE